MEKKHTEARQRWPVPARRDQTTVLARLSVEGEEDTIRLLFLPDQVRANGDRRIAVWRYSRVLGAP